MTRKLALAVLFGGFATAFLTAADEPLPKAETLLDRYVQVTGGAAAYEKHKTEITTGTMEFPAMGLKGTLTRYAAAPDKEYSVMELDGIGKIETGIGGGIAWEKSAILGPRVKSGEEKAQSIRVGTFNAPIKWKSLYSKVETTGSDTVSGEDCYKVVLTPAEGKPETMFFSKKSGLLLKASTTAVTQMGDVPVEVIAADYKDFDGVLTPTKSTQKGAGQEFTMTIQSVQVNVEIPAGRFDPPADVKALVK